MRYKIALLFIINLLTSIAVGAQEDAPVCTVLDTAGDDSFVANQVDIYAGGIVSSSSDGVYVHPFDQDERVTVSQDGNSRFIQATGTAERVLAADGDGVYVYEPNGDMWEPAATLIEPDLPPDQMYGFTLALIGDTVIVGAPYDFLQSQGDGDVFIYERDDAGDWTRTSVLSDADDEPDNFGVMLDTTIIDDTPYLMVGSRFVGTYLYRQSTDGAWEQITQPEGTAGVSIDGETAVTLTYPADPASGDPITVLVYDRMTASDSATESWTQSAEIDPSAVLALPMQIALGGDVLVLSGQDAMGPDAQNIVIVYQREDDAWSQITTLTSADAGGLFGESIATDGETIIMTMSASGSASGAIYRTTVAQLRDHTPDDPIVCQ
jgi:hypothetical protein